jgi:hypothetical protein
LLPVITIGLTDTAVPVAVRIAAGRPVTHFPDMEAAHWGLCDGADNPLTGEAGGAGDLSRPIIMQDSDLLVWQCHVIYGELEFGAAVTKTHTPIPHVGTTIALVDTIGTDPQVAVRVTGGQPGKTDSRRNLIISGAGMLACKAFGVIEDLDPTAEVSLTGFLTVAEVEFAAMGVR